MNILVAFLVTNRISHIPVQCVSGGQAWTLKTCPTRTFIGMRTVLSAEGVRLVQWKSHLQLRTPSYFVQAAMMQNLLAGAMPVVTLSDQVNYIFHILIYRVFQLDMTYFEVQDGQLKLTSKFKKRQQHIREMGTFEFYQYFFKKVILAGLSSL